MVSTVYFLCGVAAIAGATFRVAATPACTGLLENPQPFYTGPLREVSRVANGIRYETGVRSIGDSVGNESSLLHVVKTKKGHSVRARRGDGPASSSKRSCQPVMLNLTMQICCLQ